MYIHRIHSAISRRPGTPNARILVVVALFGLSCLSSENGDDAVVAPLSADFSESQTAGTPGTAIQFNDTSTGDVTQYMWDFGGLGTRDEANPLVTFPSLGTYSVGLTVEGPRGTSTTMKLELIVIGESPIASFSCLPTQGFAPLTVSCTSTSTAASGIAWDFGDGSTSDQSAVEHTYTSAGVYSVELTASGSGDVDQVNETIDVFPLGISSDPVSGSAPLDVSFSGVSGGLTGFIIWTVDGQVVNGAQTLQHRFRNPGTFPVTFIIASFSLGITGEVTIQYVVSYGPAVADFFPSVPGGNGPLEVVLMDISVGEIEKWEWDFGDGTQCVTPAPSEPDPMNPIPICESTSPSHAYQNVGEYDVTLTVTGPAANPDDPQIVSSTTMLHAVRVHITDPSFEFQTANSEIAGAWTPLHPVDAPESAQHIALSQPAQSDAGMPTDGRRWAMIDGFGTDGSTPVDMVENGIRQNFLKPSNQPVLEFDFVLLYSEPPASPILDAVTATVSDGTTTVEIVSSQATPLSPYAGISELFPLRDGSDVRVTPVLTASINLTEAFPTATDRTLFTLTIRTTNASNEFRSPMVYVDNIRFTESSSELTAQFALETDPIVVGQEAVFTDESCPDPDSGTCSMPTSWRWDFDTQSLANPPTASGSGEQNPAYVFPVAGDYEIRMLARLADLESEASLLVTVIDGPLAAFSITSPPVQPYSTDVALSFSDSSTSDPTDPITDWSWDFGGWGISSLQSPAPVTILQSGNWIITLTVVTASGQTDTTQSTVLVE